MITGHHNKYNNYENIWNIGRITKCYIDTKWENAVGKMASIDLLNVGLSQTLNLSKYDICREQ